MPLILSKKTWRDFYISLLAGLTGGFVVAFVFERMPLYLLLFTLFILILLSALILKALRLDED